MLWAFAHIGIASICRFEGRACSCVTRFQAPDGAAQFLAQGDRREPWVSVAKTPASPVRGGSSSIPTRAAPLGLDHVLMPLTPRYAARRVRRAADAPERFQLADEAVHQRCHSCKLTTDGSGMQVIKWCLSLGIEMGELETGGARKIEA